MSFSSQTGEKGKIATVSKWQIRSAGNLMVMSS